jgi:hypothetical protein
MLETLMPAVEYFVVTDLLHIFVVSGSAWLGVEIEVVQFRLSLARDDAGR